MKKEVEADLPNKTEHVLKVELSIWQKMIYDQIEKKTISSIDATLGAKGGTKTFNNLVMQLRKVCGHPYLFLENW